MDNFRQRLCFSAPTVSDILMDSERKNEFQDLTTFFGTDELGNTIIMNVNQTYSFSQSHSLVYVQDQSGLEFINKETVNGSYEFSSWKTPSLQFQCIVPMQTWRIVFSGCLRNSKNLRHVKINFLWKPFGFPVYCNKENTFFKHEIDDTDPNITQNILGFDQFGQISGIMVVDGKKELINMRAIKLRRWNIGIGDSSLYIGFIDNSICSVQKLKGITCSGHFKINLKHEILAPNNGMCLLDEEKCKASITIQHEDFNLNENLKIRNPIIMNNVSIETIFGDFPKSKGILICLRDTPKNDAKIKRELIPETDHNNLTVNLESELCMFSNIVGNKAKSLFLLKKAITNGSIIDAIVPNGICITTTAMRNHINKNEDLSIGLKDLIKIATEDSNFEQLSNYCRRLQNLWRSSKISAELLEAISNYTVEHGIYAIRSSGMYEDDEFTSSAGQYVTVLDCAGHLDDVVTAVLECWSSNFSTRALTYRKNNGQPLMCVMAVIVQEQVTGQGVAGVMFTRDPNTGDPEKITIALSYGLGESVVSGSVEPISIVISRSQFTTVHEDPVTRLFNFKMENNVCHTKPCISDDVLKKLVYLCVQIESVFGSPQDIEWVIVEDRVYLLQSRPITSIFAWTNDEITREFDTPFTCDDVVMFYNVKEVYPNPMHPLSLTLDFFSMYPLFKLTVREPTEIYRNKQLFYTHYNLCLNVCQIFQDLEPHSVFVKIIEYSIAGKSFLTNDMWEKILSKNRNSALKKIFKSISTLKDTLFLESRLAETQKLICSVNVEQSDSSLSILSKINNVLDIFEKVTFCHIASSSNNIVSHTLLAIIGLDFNKDSPTESLSNLASSINTPDIINVSILTDIQDIACVISEMSNKEDFCNLPVENCYDWLKLNCEKGYDKVQDFINKYGHRGVQELDFGSETWSTEPNRLFSCLQSLVSLGHRQSPVKPIENHSSTVPRGYIKQMVFNYLLRKYRQSITYREQSKDMLVQITHKLRLGYRKLGENLAADGKIPDWKLIFFMSQFEARKICENNYCPLIVHKALKRRKLWPTLSSLQFDDVCCGSPVPKNLIDKESIDSSTRLKGCCVFPGRVKNRACVLEHIEDTRCLRSGDILIVKSVDIAWSPYFPIISGLVTEIGGIISHGAVVAREYGLPCLVGVQNAKKYFKSGDMVILDSEKGFIIKDNMTN
ncbi:uncharacterized protein LOC112681979 [Sipha flava]|uniref:Putative phosphoenolpyruvate synthase n=2 Tax=Sipha flava TaxID=143950 RepID=A0A2S2QE21_9HEMI|nr:uncharacterized protein LOC112681979 [Sipha flava]